MKLAQKLAQAEMNTLLQHGWTWDGQCLDGWHVTEKLDGCRAYWDGSAFFSREGRKLANMPDRITSMMPAFPVDGEMFAGYVGLNLAMVAVVHGKYATAVRFVAFDCPAESGGWSQRIVAARQHGLECVQDFGVMTTGQALEALAIVQDRGGEGLVAYHPSARYQPGRCQTVQKILPESACQWNAPRFDLRLRCAGRCLVASGA